MLKTKDLGNKLPKPAYFCRPKLIYHESYRRTPLEGTDPGYNARH